MMTCSNLTMAAESSSNEGVSCSCPPARRRSHFCYATSWNFFSRVPFRRGRRRRAYLPWLAEGAGAAGLSPMAREVGRYLAQRGASFLADIARGTGLLKVKAEEALWQLVAPGFATGDGIAGLRVLLTPETKRKGRRLRLRVISGGRTAERMMPVG